MAKLLDCLHMQFKVFKFFGMYQPSAKRKIVLVITWSMISIGVTAQIAYLFETNSVRVSDHYLTVINITNHNNLKDLSNALFILLTMLSFVMKSASYGKQLTRIKRLIRVIESPLFSTTFPFEIK